MPSTSLECRRGLRGGAFLALAGLVGLLLSWPALAAKDKPGQICEVAGTLTGEGQLRERTKKCKKDDVLVASLVSASLAATRVAALVCDLSDQILIEETTESPGIARITCTFAGGLRSKR